MRFLPMVLVLVAASVMPVAANSMPIPATEWTAEARHNLARCLVGEAGWEAPDHAAIPWALAKSWGQRIRAGYELSFAEQVARYCAALRVTRPTTRQQWVRDLPDGMVTEANRPPSFPRHLDWMAYAIRWENVRVFTSRWANGEVRNPCPGAEHWGGTIDQIPHGAVPACGNVATRNTFYFMRPVRRGDRIPAAIARGTS